MDEAMQPQDAVQQKSTNFLAAGIAASVLLHLVGATLLVALPKGSSPNPPATYIDLKMLQTAAASAPLKAPPAPPKPVAAASEEIAIPEHNRSEPQTQPAPPQPQQAHATDQPTNAQEAPAEDRSRTTLGMGLTKGYFKGLADGESLREGVKEYYLQMLQGINEKWWLDQQVDKRRVDPLVVNLVIARNGEIVGSRVLRGSGNPRYDRAVLAALNAAGPLPPLPNSYEGDFFEAPIRLVPPLNLLTW